MRPAAAQLWALVLVLRLRSAVGSRRLLKLRIHAASQRKGSKVVTVKKAKTRLVLECNTSKTCANAGSLCCVEQGVNSVSTRF